MSTVLSICCVLIGVVLFWVAIYVAGKMFAAGALRIIKRWLSNSKEQQETSDGNG